MLGLGILSSFGWQKESTYGVAPSPTPVGYWPVVSQNILAPRESIDSMALVGQREIQNVALGIKALSGQFVVENDGNNIGQPMRFWNGDPGYSVQNMSTQGMWVTTAPSLTTTSGGSNAAGTYRYIVCPVGKRAIDLYATIFPPTPESGAVTVSGSNNTINVGYTDVTTLVPPLGFTMVGAMIFKTPTNGTAGTETYWDYCPVGTSPSSYVDTGVSAHADPLVTAPTAVSTIYRHRYLGTPPTSGVDPIPSFTLTAGKDNDMSEQYAGCRMNEMKFGASGPNAPINVNFSVMGQNSTLVANPTPSFTALEQMLGWKCAAFLNNGTNAFFIEAFDVNCTNNCQAVPGFMSTPYNRDVAAGFRKISGSIKRNNDDHTFWSMVDQGTEFGLKFNFYGQPVVSAGSNTFLAQHGITASPFPFFMEVELFRCRTPKTDNPVSGSGRIIETVDFTAYQSASFGTAMRVNLYNTTPSYV